MMEMTTVVIVQMNWDVVRGSILLYEILKGRKLVIDDDNRGLRCVKA